MNKRLLGGLLLAALALSATGGKRLTRTAMAATEKSFDHRLEREVLEGDPFLLLGMTRGVYVEGAGMVYSAEVNLAPVPGISPFHPEMTKQDWARVRTNKLKRLPSLKAAMKQMLIDSAATLDGVPTDERMVLGITLTRHPHEDSNGVPSQIVMQAVKKNLLDVQAGRLDRAQLDTLIKVVEY
jgi:hypothetical protein